MEVLRGLDVSCDICFNDQITEEKVISCDRVIISPGPGLPYDSIGLMDFIESYKDRIPMLGVCLGHQALGLQFGAELHQLTHPRHGKSVEIEIVKEDALFHDLPRNLQGGLYHSWTLSPASIPAELEVIASYNGAPMAIRHKHLNLRGVQFHPESIATPQGAMILENWVTFC